MSSWRSHLTDDLDIHRNGLGLDQARLIVGEIRGLTVSLRKVVVVALLDFQPFSV